MAKKIKVQTKPFDFWVSWCLSQGQYFQNNANTGFQFTRPAGLSSLSEKLGVKSVPEATDKKVFINGNHATERTKDVGVFVCRQD